jgi:hypothetical protein
MQEAKDIKEIQRRLQPPMVEGDAYVRQRVGRYRRYNFKEENAVSLVYRFGISFLIAQSLLFTVVYLVVTGIGIWGNNQPVGWAFRHYQLRLVDRYRTRRNADFCDSSVDESKMAHVLSTVSPKR